MKLDPLYFFLPMIEALDREEHDLVGATVGHGKRVAYLSYLMTRSLPWSPDERLAFVLAALLHDCGSVETIREMRDAARNEMYPLYWTPSKEGTFCVIRLNLS